MEEFLHISNTLSKILVLMYHRIDITETDPWGICVSPENLEAHIQFLKKNYIIISCDDLVKQVKTGSIKSDSICITFDDGYADNYIHAKPVIEKFNCPAAFFISTAFINQAEPFWWDVLELALLCSKKLPHYLLLNISGEDYEYLFDSNELTKQQWLQHTRWKYYEEPPTDRCSIFLEIWNKLRPLPYQEINMQINVIKKWAGIDNSWHKQRLPVNEKQLEALSESSLFTIGMHTHTHPDLQVTEKQLQHTEIIQCKNLLRSKYGTESNYFAYPYGRYNDDTIELVNDLKIDACFTTKEISINTDADLKRIGRYQVGNWDIGVFKEYLNKWSK